MSIFEDARNGNLNKGRLDGYLSNNPNILTQQEFGSGLTPLGIAVVEGFPEEPDGLSGNDPATPLLLAAWRTKKERPRIIQLLLAKIPSGDASIDATSSAAENNTPLINDGFNAKEVGDYLGDNAVLRALDPEKEKLDLGKLAMVVLDFLLYISLGERRPGRRYSPGIQAEPRTRPKHRPHVSTSMKHEDRWENQKKHTKRITQVATRILPEGEGVALRFVNQDVDNAFSLTLAEISKILDPMSWQPGDKTLQRPLLVSIITDGMPEPEDKSELANVIVKCGNALQSADYPHESMNIVDIVTLL
ncbi:hypothetical protein BDN71DRAFT_1532644 [Pleurotus eryngii]|uniref:Ankyrin repeat protein n=1 Tax=Pleurotus eryngii TaxID=5323 RepID=A0A9P6A236_PLEER|nr:hypothetical protein BDN71DRAFT_1532644 [Pleurotus eryngii]